MERGLDGAAPHTSQKKRNEWRHEWTKQKMEQRVYSIQRKERHTRMNERKGLSFCIKDCSYVSAIGNPSTAQQKKGGNKQ